MEEGDRRRTTVYGERREKIGGNEFNFFRRGGGDEDGRRFAGAGGSGGGEATTEYGVGKLEVAEGRAEVGERRRAGKEDGEDSDASAAGNGTAPAQLRASGRPAGHRIARGG